MRKNYKMCVDNGFFKYPEEIKDEFLATEDLPFRDDTRITPDEIWYYMTESAPRKFPHAFSTSPYSVSRLPTYVELLNSIKFAYLELSFRDRLQKAKKRGVPVVLVQGGQTLEPYTAAGAIALRPYFVILWAQNLEEGLSLRQMDRRTMEILEEGQRAVSMEACHQVSAHAAIRNGIVPIDLIAPYLCLRCSDMAYLSESHRGSERKTPVLLVDFPINNSREKEWAIDYVAKNLRLLVQKIDEISGNQTKDKDLMEEIKLANQGRELARKINEMWWSAERFPTNSAEIRKFLSLGNDYLGDPLAGIHVLERAYNELKERVDQGAKGAEIADDPVRLFICGSCSTPNPHHIERVGGVILGYDDTWSKLCVDIEEKGDPYKNIAKAMLSYPYELPTRERALWTAEQCVKSRADGLIYSYNWGCNFQSAVARMISDIVKKEAGIPTMLLELGELGRSEAIEQSQNRIEAFIEMIAQKK